MSSKDYVVTVKLHLQVRIGADIKMKRIVIHTEQGLQLEHLKPFADSFREDNPDLATAEIFAISRIWL